MKRKKRIDWTFMRDEGREIYCARCGQVQPIELPIEVPILCRKIGGFNLLHADCPPTPSSEKGQP